MNTGELGDIPMLLVARAEFYELAAPTKTYRRYVEEQNLDLDRITGFAGATGIIEVADCGGDRFDWAAAGHKFPAFVCEALSKDGETVEDLVAWPVDASRSVYSMFGTCAWLGAWAVWNPATYYMRKPLEVHRTPLDWLKAGCRGAAIVCPQLAAREMIDLPGPVAVQDGEHARVLLALMRGLSSRTQVLVPRETRVTA